MGRDAAGSSILYLLCGSQMERRQAACVAEGHLVGEEGGTIVDCVGVASVRVVPEAYVGSTKDLLIRLKLFSRSSTYLIQMLWNLGNPHAPVMRVMKLCFQFSRPQTLPITCPRPQLSRYLASPPSSQPQLSRSFAHLHYSWPLTGMAQTMNLWA